MHKIILNACGLLSLKNLNKLYTQPSRPKTLVMGSGNQCGFFEEKLEGFDSPCVFASTSGIFSSGRI